MPMGVVDSESRRKKKAPSTLVPLVCEETGLTFLMGVQLAGRVKRSRGQTGKGLIETLRRLPDDKRAKIQVEGVLKAWPEDLDIITDMEPLALAEVQFEEERVTQYKARYPIRHLSKDPWFTRERAAVILYNIEIGCTKEMAAGAAGVTRQYLESWMKSKDDPALTEFQQWVYTAMSRFNSTYLSRISDASKDPRNWTAAAWALERIQPDNYGQRRKVQVEERKNVVIYIPDNGRGDEGLQPIVEGEIAGYLEEEDLSNPATPLLPMSE